MLPNPTECKFVSTDAVDSFEGVIVDVRTPEAHEESHIPGTGNHCVYQVDFLEKFPEAYPDKDTAILVYGDGDPYKADLAALGRLQYLGYTNVSILEGGLSRWTAESRETEGSGASEEGVSESQHFDLDREKTKVRWVGRNLMNQHNGVIGSKEGFIEVSESGAPVSGKVVVDLTQMDCLDLTDKGLADMLIGHLASADFFDTANFPEASFEMISAIPIDSATYGMPNYKVLGKLNARGLSMDLEIDSLIERVDGGYVFQSAFNFDRTQLGALYGSGRIFERLGMHLVNDLVSMDVAAFFTATK